MDLLRWRLSAEPEDGRVRAGWEGLSDPWMIHGSSDSHHPIVIIHLSSTIYYIIINHPLNIHSSSIYHPCIIHLSSTNHYCINPWVIHDWSVAMGSRMGFFGGLRSSIRVLGQVAVRSSGEERSLSLPGTPRCQGAANVLLMATLWWTNILPWTITIFNGNIHHKWPVSIAMLVHQWLVRMGPTEFVSGPKQEFQLRWWLPPKWQNPGHGMNRHGRGWLETWGAKSKKTQLGGSVKTLWHFWWFVRKLDNLLVQNAGTASISIHQSSRDKANILARAIPVCSWLQCQDCARFNWMPSAESCGASSLVIRTGDVDMGVSENRLNP